VGQSSLILVEKVNESEEFFYQSKNGETRAENLKMRLGGAPIFKLVSMFFLFTKNFVVMNYSL